MSRKNLLLAAWLAVVAVVIAAGVVRLCTWQNEVKLQGKLVFAKTYDLGDKIDRIVITSAEEVTELVQKNSFWLVKGKGGYFADFGLMHQLLSAINQSIYVVELPYDEKLLQEHYLLDPKNKTKDSGILIQTFINNEMIDEMIVGLPDENKSYFFAKRPENNEIWLIDGNFDLPIMSRYWLFNPVVSVPKDEVEKVTIDSDYAQRAEKTGYFENNLGRYVNLETLLNVLSAVTIVDAKDEQEFRKEELDQLESKVVDIVTFYGLEFVCKIYYDQENVWLNINLTTTPLPMSAVNDYIRDNRFLYDGWYFKISPRQGHILRDFRLI